MPRNPHLAAATRVAQLDAAGRQEMTDPARRARAEKLRNEIAAEVDPDGTLAVNDPVEFETRVAAQRRLYFARLGRTSGENRRARSAERRRAEAKAEFLELADAELRQAEEYARLAGLPSSVTPDQVVRLLQVAGIGRPA